MDVHAIAIGSELTPGRAPRGSWPFSADDGDATRVAETSGAGGETRGSGRGRGLGRGGFGGERQRRVAPGARRDGAGAGSAPLGGPPRSWGAGRGGAGRRRVR